MDGTSGYRSGKSKLLLYFMECLWGGVNGNVNVNVNVQ